MSKALEILKSIQIGGINFCRNTTNIDKAIAELEAMESRIKELELDLVIQKNIVLDKQILIGKYEVRCERLEYENKHIKRLFYV